jgi:hypothetical protein
MRPSLTRAWAATHGEQRRRHGEDVVVVVEANGFGDQRGSCRNVASGKRAQRPGDRGRGGSPPVFELVEPTARFPGEGNCALEGAGTIVSKDECQLDEGRFPGRLGGRRQVESALTSFDRRIEIVVFGRELAGVRQQLDADREWHVLRRPKRGLDEGTSLRDARGDPEVPPETDAETGGDERVGRLAGIGEGSPEVVVLQLDHPVGPLRAA